MGIGICLGIDQGGTKTDAVLMDLDGRILSKGKSGGANYAADGIQLAMEQIDLAAKDAAAAGEIALNRIGLISVCMTGADWEYEYDYLRNQVKKLFHDRVLLENDCMGALRGGTEAKQSGVICLGTGANVAVQNENGKKIVYGYFVRDNVQGAGAIGRQAVEAVVGAYIGIGDKTGLTQMILDYTFTSSVHELVERSSMGKLDIPYKNIAPFVFLAAKKGDAVARRIVHTMAVRLCDYVLAGMRSLHMLDEAFELVLSGGVFKNNGYLLAEEIKRLLAEFSNIKITEGRYEPVVGCALLGLDQIYTEGLPPGVVRNVEQSCQSFELIRKF